MAAGLPTELRLSLTPRGSDGGQLARAVVALAHRQDGVVSRAQLIDLGLARATVDRWARVGRLTRIHPGVFAAGHAALRPRGWRRAAVLACGDETVLSHRFGGVEWELVPPPSGPVDVIPPRRGGGGLPGIRAHRIALDEEDRAVHEGMPVTSVCRTILDVARDATERYLAAMLDQAVLLDLYNAKAMAQCIDRCHGHRGLRMLLPLVEKLDGTRFRSGTEHVVRDRLVAAGVPRARVNVPVLDRHELDLLWPELRLNVELDGPQHELPLQQAADQERDAELRSAGYRVVRIPLRNVTMDDIVARIKALLRLSLAG